MSGQDPTIPTTAPPRSRRRVDPRRLPRRHAVVLLAATLLLAALAVVLLRLADDGPPALVYPDDLLLAPPRGTAEDAVATAEARDAGRLDEVRAYVAEVYRLAPLVGLDPAIVVAQSAHETAFWRSPAWRDHLNPAGIGITGPDAPSPTWANGTDAARAQIVHLYLYAVGEIPPNHLLAPFIPLDPRYDAAVAAGRAAVASTLVELAGTWATDPDYAEGVARAGNALFAG